jgi:hypothetical protein
MMSIVSFLMFLGWLMLAYRALNFIRRAKDAHRARLLAMGFVENNKPWRLRQDRYERIAFISYAVSGAILDMIVLAKTNGPIGGFIAFLAAVFFGFVIGAVIGGVYGSYTEIVHHIGVLALLMRDTQFYHPISPLEPDGGKGTAKVASPAKVGLLNPIRWIAGPAQPVVSEGSR